MKEVKLKVCGLTQRAQFEQLSAMPVTYGGLIFYPKSSRFIGDKLSADEVKKIKGLQKVGVFVDSSEEEVLEKTRLYGLDLVQLHGDESPEFCKIIRQHVSVIKAFRVENQADIAQAKAYDGCCDYFLFDTAGKLYGGNGELFNWELLEQYSGRTEFFLSGGIGPEEATALKKFDHPRLKAIDVNSRFEVGPGVKNVDQLKDFIEDLGLA